jgi:hypothetical protein
MNPQELANTMIEDFYRSTVQQTDSAFARQEGGDHYKGFAIQPVEYIHKNGLGFIEGSVVKYVIRWRTKGGLEDLQKARHFLDLLIEMETPNKL